MNTTSTEDLSSWEVLRSILGLPGIATGLLGALVGLWLSFYDKANLLQYIKTLLGPNSVLIGAAVVAITFASNWDKVNSEQVKQRDKLILSATVLSVVTVLAGFIPAGVYIAVASGKDLDLIGAEQVLDLTGPLATVVLTASLGGLATLIFRLGMLVRRRTGQNDLST